MGKGITRIDANIIAEWFVQDKRRGGLKELLLLPDTYNVEDVAIQSGEVRYRPWSTVDVTLSSPDIPDVPDDSSLPDIVLSYRATAVSKSDPELAEIAVMDGSKTLYEVKF